jgi:hypothetical protein
MKKSDIEIGKVYAYSRTATPDSTYQVSGFVVDSLDIPESWRGNAKQEVKGRFTKSDGTIQEDANFTNVNIRKLIGEYLPIRHDLELREKNREISRLNQQIATTKIEGIIKAHAEVITKRLEIKYYDIRNTYDGKATITLTAQSLQELVRAFQSLDRYEEQAERERAERQAEWEREREAVNA